jgi:RND family efflux transporter MFP subunit
VLEVPELNDDLVHAAAQVEHDRSEVTRAADELRRAESAYAAAHAAYSRLAEVVKSRPNLVAQQELDDALAKDRVGQAQVSAAQAALESAKQQVQVALAAQTRLRTMVAYSRISAPFAGVITKRYADPGAMIQAGTASQTQAMPLVTLAEADRLRLIVPVPESAVSRVRIGSPVAVRVPALNRTFEGKVARFTGQVQSSTRTMDTEVDVPNPRFELVPGMYAYATITLERRPGVLAIPVQAVSGLESSSPSVLVVSPRNVLEQRPVRLGIEEPSEVEVVSGLRENELIVAANPGRYRPGEEVAPKPLQIAARSGEEVR